MAQHHRRTAQPGESNTGSVAGYNTTASYAPDAASFNAQNHARTDLNLDLSALARYTPDARQQYELAYAQKTRSPNLYERYTWSSNTMAAVMNNFAGDGNGYVGNANLKPEVAHTSAAAPTGTPPTAKPGSSSSAPTTAM
jgi:iron complex outermembrane receptor protein